LKEEEPVREKQPTIDSEKRKGKEKKLALGGEKEAEVV